MYVLGVYESVDGDLYPKQHNLPVFLVDFLDDLKLVAEFESLLLVNVSVVASFMSSKEKNDNFLMYSLRSHSIQQIPFLKL